MKKILATLGIISFIIITIFIIVNYRNSHNIDKILEKNLYSITNSYTLEQAEKDGIINIDTIQEKNTTIEKFLNDVSMNKWSILKTANSIDNNLIICLYINDNKAELIKGYTYQVNMQGIDHNYFSQKFNIKKENNLCEVWLTNVKNPENPSDEEIMPKDEILYSYYEQEIEATPDGEDNSETFMEPEYEQGIEAIPSGEDNNETMTKEYEASLGDPFYAKPYSKNIELELILLD